VAVPPSLTNENYLIDAELFVPPKVLPELSWCSNGACAKPIGSGRRFANRFRVVTLFGTPTFELAPYVGDPRSMISEEIVVSERITELLLVEWRVVRLART